MGVDTHLYLIDRRRYEEIAVPALGALLNDGSKTLARSLFEEACAVLASQNHEFPWSPLHQVEDQLNEGIRLIDGYDANTAATEDVVFGPRYHIIESVCGVVVEGSCVPWHLPFPPVHCISCDSAVWELYKIAPRFEDVFAAEIYIRNRPAPFGIASGDAFVDKDVIRELWNELSRKSNAKHPLLELAYFRNLLLLLEQGCRDEFEVLASYY